MSQYRIAKTIDADTNQRVCVVMAQHTKGARYAPLVKNGKVARYIGQYAVPASEAHKDMLDHTREANLAGERLIELVKLMEEEQAQAAETRIDQDRR